MSKPLTDTFSELYKEYVNSLFDALQIEGKGNYQLLKPLFDKIDSGDLQHDPALASLDFRKFTQQNYGYPNTPTSFYPEKGDYAHNAPLGKNDLGKLSKDQVQRLMDKIKRACCPQGSK